MCDDNNMVLTGNAEAAIVAEPVSFTTLLGQRNGLNSDECIDTFAVDIVLPAVFPYKVNGSDEDEEGERTCID